MGTPELTREEAAMLEHMIHIHLSERRFEIEEFETRFTCTSPGQDRVSSGRSYGRSCTSESHAVSETNPVTLR